MSVVKANRTQKKRQKYNMTKGALSEGSEKELGIIWLIFSHRTTDDDSDQQWSNTTRGGGK